jgi:hypothetical protein
MLNQMFGQFGGQRSTQASSDSSAPAVQYKTGDATPPATQSGQNIQGGINFSTDPRHDRTGKEIPGDYMFPGQSALPQILTGAPPVQRSDPAPQVGTARVTAFDSLAQTLKRRRQMNTLLTGGQGVLDSATTSETSLLGG